MHTEATKVRRTLKISAMGLAAAAVITLGPADARAQSGAPAPPPGFEPMQAPPPPQGYYVPPSVAASGPRVIKDWEEGEPVPPGYHPVRRVRTGLIVGGAVTFGVTYLLSALAGAIASDVGARSGKLLFIPVAGPFTLLGSTVSAVGQFGLVIDGLAQAGGLAMLIAGIAAPKTVLVRNDLGKAPKLEIMPMPMTFGSNSAGFGFVGKF